MRERERHRCEREASIRHLPYTPGPGIEPAIQACGLTRNRTCTPSVTEGHSNQVTSARAKVVSFLGKILVGLV